MAVVYGEDVMWINQGKTEVGYDTNTTIAPKSTFPFTRLASVLTLDNQNNYLYHQMNETTFAEEYFEASMGEWGEPTYINFTPPP